MQFDARLYNLLHRGNPGDIPFYRSLVEPGSSVLELGCGSGRITIPLLDKDAMVTGVDNHPGMLEILKQRSASLPDPMQERLSIVLGDMAQFSLDTPFDIVIVPYNALLCLLSEKTLFQCLTQIKKSLKPGGELVFDIYYLSLEDSMEPDVEEDQEDFEQIAQLEMNGQNVDVYESHAPNPDPRRFDTTYRHIITPQAGPSKEYGYTIEQRCIYIEEISSLMADAGFEVISITGDFLDMPINDDTSQLVVRARKC